MTDFKGIEGRSRTFNKFLDKYTFKTYEYAFLRYIYGEKCKTAWQ